MRTAEEIAASVRSRLPASTLAGLREAFEEEVVDRLPRLREAARTLDPELLPDALRDVHTLGSSAYMVAENDVARAAREAEAILKKGGPLERFAEIVVDLDERLTGWTA